MSESSLFPPATAIVTLGPTVPEAFIASVAATAVALAVPLAVQLVRKDDRRLHESAHPLRLRHGVQIFQTVFQRGSIVGASFTDARSRRERESTFAGARKGRPYIRQHSSFASDCLDSASVSSVTLWFNFLSDGFRAMRRAASPQKRCRDHRTPKRNQSAPSSEL